MAVCDPLSAAFMVKVNTPAVLGVPVIAPLAGFTVKPPGKVPALTEYVYGLVPPAALQLPEYGVPTTP